MTVYALYHSFNIYYDKKILESLYSVCTVTCDFLHVKYVIRSHMHN